MSEKQTNPQLVFHGKGTGLYGPPELSRVYPDRDGKPKSFREATMESTDEGGLEVTSVGSANVDDMALFASYIATNRGQEVGLSIGNQDQARRVVISGEMPKRSEVKAGLTPDERAAILDRFSTIETPDQRRLSTRRKLAIGYLAKKAVESEQQ